MALIDNEPFEGEDIDFEDNQNKEIPEEQDKPQDNSESVIDKVIPDKYKNKSIEDIVKMHQEAEKMIGKQAQEVHEVRSLADQLLKRQLEDTKKPDVIESAPEVDFFENPQTAVQKAIETNPAVLEAKQAALELKKMKTAQQLAAKHPDFGTIANDSGFQEWVKASKVRLSLYAKADAEFDFESADELLTTYKELKQVRTNNVQATGDKQKAQALKAAGVDSGGSGEVTKKVYRRADLIRLKMTDPDRYEMLQPEIMAAYSEGRVK
jgi:hypothetical protein